MKKILKIVAIVVGVALLCGILWFTNAMVGNPVSRLLANNHAESYGAQHYGDLDLVRDKATYSFKTGYYYVWFHSETEDDLHFSFSYDSFGNLKRDGYQSAIAEGGNVLARLYTDYHQVTATVFDGLEQNSLFDGEYFHASGHLLGTDGTTLELDVDYDVAQMGYTDGELDISLDFADGDTSFERGVQALLLVKEAFDQAGVGFATISFGIYNAEGSYAYYAQGIPYEDLYEEGLAERIETAYEATDASFYMK